jgi:hypothetical protein
MKKMKKFATGGGIESTQGKNKMIGDDVRARAMASIAALAKKDEESEDTKYAKRLYGGESDESRYAKKLYSEEPEVAPKNSSDIDLQSIVKRAATSGGMKKGGKVSSASKRADGCAVKGKTKGRMV